MESDLQPSSEASNQKSLLSLDGGGVKGISSLRVLEAIMNQVKEFEKENLSNHTYTGSKSESQMDEERFPVDYFDLAAGTSTGGLIALMLFRLRMKTSDAIKFYHELAAQVFSPTIWWGAFNMHKWGRLGYYIGNPWLKFKALAFPSRFSDKPLIDAINKAINESDDPNDRENKGESRLVRDRPDKTGKM